MGEQLLLEDAGRGQRVSGESPFLLGAASWLRVQQSVPCALPSGSGGDAHALA